MPTTARFDIQRRKHLERVFSEKKLTKLWRDVVKDQIRNLEVRDLHDFYDFNYSIESRAAGIAELVCSGLYRASVPLVYRSEKKLGICRHMLVPTPSDALVLQALSETLYDDVKRSQPSTHAYYARQRHTVKLPHEVKNASGYPWQLLWPKYQQEIWNFTKAHAFLVTTDIANYFDNIGLRELRHVISSITKIDEVLLDLLFSLVEDLAWRPDYLPTSHQGLPTIEVEAPRLLAHALLFDVDLVLKDRTGDCFVRWMDDINIGVASIDAGRTLLGDVNDVLKSRGLALNIGKTSILTSQDAQRHFLFRANVRVSKLEKRAERLKSEVARGRLASRVEGELREHLRKSSARNKSKLTKRYLTVLSKLALPVAFDDLPVLFSDEPDLRRSILRFLTSVPFSSKAGKTYLRLLDRTQRLDDLTLYSWADGLVDWVVPRDRMGKRFVAAATDRLAKPDLGFEWYCQVRFAAKYGDASLLLEVLDHGKKRRIREPFLERQAVAASTRLLETEPRFVERFWLETTATGSADAASVAANLLALREKGFPAKNDRFHFYLFPTTKQRPYPIAKFLLLCLLAYEEVRMKKATTNFVTVGEYVTDPWYRHWLRAINPNWKFGMKSTK